ncbi:BnaCnng23450D [Brassica napus]|uniref:BnaCnng23450D protein n=1 Tax=Brassica napus TaxID=3708 RepID=A0A078ISI6_BRANA|nr:BnaCnng23450D [Brassica napus]
MDIITANLGAGLISTIVQLGLCINLFFTFPLMMNPVFEIVERRFFVLGGEQHLLHLRLCVTCIAGVQGTDGVEAMESGHSDSGTGRGSCCVGNLEFTERDLLGQKCKRPEQ